MISPRCQTLNFLCIFTLLNSIILNFSLYYAKNTSSSGFLLWFLSFGNPFFFLSGPHFTLHLSCLLIALSHFLAQNAQNSGHCICLTCHHPSPLDPPTKFSLSFLFPSACEWRFSNRFCFRFTQRKLFQTRGFFLTSNSPYQILNFYRPMRSAYFRFHISHFVLYLHYDEACQHSLSLRKDWTLKRKLIDKCQKMDDNAHSHMGYSYMAHITVPVSISRLQQ